MIATINSRTAVLVELLRGPGTLVELVSRIEARSQRQALLSSNWAYSMMKELVDGGFVSADTAPARGRRRPGAPANTYTLTPKGRQLAREQQRGLCAFFSMPEAE